MTTATRTEPVRVPWNGIGDGLRTIWRRCERASADDGLQRSLTVNLVAIAPIEQRAPLQAAIERARSRLPCRVFCVLLDRQVRGHEATVSGEFRSRGGDREIVLELIELQTDRREFERVAGVIRPLLVHDLPTHVFWLGELPSSDRVVDLISQNADHLVVDSASVETPMLTIERIEGRRLLSRKVTDLVWLRVRPWRRALAEGFERLSWRPEVATRVLLRHGPGSAGIAAAHLLGRWLDRRLKADAVLQTEDGECDLHGVTVQHGDATLHARQLQHLIEVSVSTAASCHLPFAVPASRGSCGDLLAAAIDLA